MWKFILLAVLTGPALIVSAQSRDTEDEIVIDTDTSPNILMGEAAGNLVDDEDAEPMQIDAYTGARRYEGFRLIRAVPKTDEDLHVLRFVSKGSERYVNGCANITAPSTSFYHLMQPLQSDRGENFPFNISLLSAIKTHNK